MQSNVRKPDLGRLGSNSVTSGGDRKQVRKVHTRKVLYRVGYSWNKGGRLKELRIRHLARKFLKIWIQNTFGRILPHKAKSHYNSVVLRRAFGGWRDEWWASRREWGLEMRAKCHYRYYLCNLAFQHWQMFMPLQREENRKVQSAQSFADRHQMRMVWEKWQVFTEIRRMKNRKLASALEKNRLATLHSVWSLWWTQLQQHKHLYTLEDQVLTQRALRLKQRSWLQWKESLTAARCQNEKMSKAALHFILRQKRKTLKLWKSSVSSIQTLKNLQAVAQRACDLRLMATCWSKWSTALQLIRRENERLQVLEQLATRITQRRAVERWKAYVMLCREEAERNRIASQFHHHRLLSAGLQGLSLNVIRNKTQRLNKHMAVQHHHQTMTFKYWKLWQDCLEEAEDQRFPHLTVALTDHRTSQLSKCFHHWRQKHAEQRHMQELEHRADTWFSEHMLRRCYDSWVEFTLQRRLHKQRKHKAEVYNRHRHYTLAFFSWWGQSEKHKEQMLSEKLATLHEERRHLQRAWTRWRQRTEQHISEEEKRTSHHLYMHRPHKTHERHMTDVCVWRESAVSSEVRLLEQQAQDHFQHILQLKVLLAWREAAACAVLTRHQQGEAVNKARRAINQVRLLHSFQHWRQQTRTAQRARMCMEKARLHHDSKLLSKAMKAWNQHHNQYHKTKVMKRQADLLLRLKVYQMYFERWKMELQHRRREAKQMERALWHWSLTLQAKVLCGWRLWVTEQRRKQEQTARAAEVYRDELLRDGVTRILTYAAHMSHLTTSLTLHSQEQRSRRVQGVVKRCAMRWKQKVLKPRRKEEVKGQLPKKSVTFCLSDASSDSKEQETDDAVLSELQLSRVPRRQPRCCKELLESPLDISLKPTAGAAPESTQLTCPSQNSDLSVSSCFHPAKTPLNAARQTIIISNVSPSQQHMCSSDSPKENPDVLLPPSAFMTTEDALGKTLPSFKQHSSAYSDEHLRASSAEDAEMDPASVLTRELLIIQLEMVTYQQDKKQLRAWQKLKEVLQSWLQTSGKEEHTEKSAVCQELKELEEGIDTLSTELARQKPTMLLHAERIQHLQSAIQASGVAMETGRSVFTIPQEMVPHKQNYPC